MGKDLRGWDLIWIFFLQKIAFLFDMVVLLPYLDSTMLVFEASVYIEL
jgi:hypothetical protein